MAALPYYPAWAKFSVPNIRFFEEYRGDIPKCIARRSGFAEKLEPYLHGILARCRHTLDTSVLEGIHNTIKVIKRRAYGYSEQKYFFRKIRAAFPGIPR